MRTARPGPGSLVSSLPAPAASCSPRWARRQNSKSFRAVLRMWGGKWKRAGCSLAALLRTSIMARSPSSLRCLFLFHVFISFRRNRVVYFYEVPGYGRTVHGTLAIGITGLVIVGSRDAEMMPQDLSPTELASIVVSLSNSRFFFLFFLFPVI